MAWEAIRNPIDPAELAYPGYRVWVQDGDPVVGEAAVFFKYKKQAQEYADWKNAVPLPTYFVEGGPDEGNFIVTRRDQAPVFKTMGHGFKKAQAEAVAKALNETASSS